MKTLLDMFLKGGPVMWPILALSVVGLAILVWKAFEIRAGISVVDPELICLRSAMTPDVEKVKAKVAEFIPKKYLPEFVYLRDEEMQELVLLGQMILSLESLEKN